MIAAVKALPKPAQIAIAVGGALAVGWALWYLADLAGLFGVAPSGSTQTAPIEAVPSTTAARARAVVGTDSTGSPIYGSGSQSIDKSAASIARRAALSAQALTT